MTTNYISEDYCSEEIRSLLEENGYIGATNTYLDKDGFRVKEITLQSAMKWLREEHKTEIRVIYDNDKRCWYGACNPMNESQILLGFGRKCKSYEEACEEAIKYYLENLI